MRKINKIINTALIFTLIVEGLRVDVCYSEKLRVPINTKYSHIKSLAVCGYSEQLVGKRLKSVNDIDDCLTVLANLSIACDGTLGREELIAAWGHLFDVLTIPRPSKEEGKIVAHVIDTLKRLGLKYISGGLLPERRIPHIPGIVTLDKAGNVIARIYPSEGQDDHYVMFQAHLDMVCVKSGQGLPESNELQFVKHKEKIYLKGANGMNLGADDGVGVAAMLWLARYLIRNYILHAGVELLFTVDEEEDFTGAFGVNMNQFQSRGIVNLDGDVLLDTPGSGEISIGSAGAIELVSQINTMKTEEQIVNTKYLYKNTKLVVVKVEHGIGGHSGQKADAGRLNAITKLLEVIHKIKQRFPNVEIVSFSGGITSNTIPGQAAVVFIPGDARESAIDQIVSSFNDEIFEIFSLTDPHVKIVAEETSIEQYPEIKAAYNNTQRDGNAIERLIKRLFMIPLDNWGVLTRTSTSIPITSINLGILNGNPVTAVSKALLRGTDDGELKSYANYYKQGLNGEILSVIPVFDSSLNSEVVRIVRRTIEDITANTFRTLSAAESGQGTCELGVLLSKGGKREGVVIGADTKGAHSLDEELELFSYVIFVQWIAGIVKAYAQHKTEIFFYDDITTYKPRIPSEASIGSFKKASPFL